MIWPERLKALAPYMELSIVLVWLSLSYGFMTTIYPYMGIPRNMSHLCMGLILMTSGISIYGHEGESYILVSEDIKDLRGETIVSWKHCCWVIKYNVEAKWSKRKWHRQNVCSKLESLSRHWCFQLGREESSMGSRLHAMTGAPQMWRVVAVLL